MSVLFDGLTSYIKRTANLPGIANATIMGWTYQTSDPAGDMVIFQFGRNVVNYTQSYWLMVQGSDQKLAIYNVAGYTTGTVLSINAWNHVAITIAGTGANQVKGYLNGVLDITASGNTGPIAEEIEIGAFAEIGGLYPGRMDSIHIYDAVLTASEIQNQMRQSLPKRTENIKAFLPLHSVGDAGTDYSGGGNWSAAGTLVAADRPPISWSHYMDVVMPAAAVGDGIFPPWPGRLYIPQRVAA